MTQSSSSRGRPKGTGHNDRARLLAIAELLAKNPDLKTTTAIKSTGVTDPSAIRRLRDKFQATRDDLIAEVADAAPAAHAAPAPKKKSILAAKPKAASESALSAEPTPVVTAAAAPVIAHGEPAPVRAPDPSQWLALWYGIGLQSLTSAVGFQISFLEKVMRMPHVASALKRQVAFNEMTLALCSASQSKLKTLH